MPEAVYEIEATIKIKYKVGGKNEDEYMMAMLEEGELELMLAKDMADCTYTDNQSCRFDEVEVIEIKAREVKDYGKKN